MRQPKDKYLLILAIIGIVFFFIYSYLPISQLIWQNQNNAKEMSLKFNTPDEVINYYFTQKYAKTGELYYFEPIDNFMNRVIFPRWAYVIDGRITPGNFIGIDLIYGTLAKIYINIIPFLTPFFAVVGVLFFYLLIKELFSETVKDNRTLQHSNMAPGRNLEPTNTAPVRGLEPTSGRLEPTARQIAFISALLVFIFPGFWYYASRVMFHNVLFLFLLITALYFLIKLIAELRGIYPVIRRGKRGTTRKWALAVLTGLFFGLAMITRTSEIFWVFLMVLMVLMFNLKKLKDIWPYLLISLVIFSACFIPVLYQNKILYNNYFSTGYPLHTMTENLESGQVGGASFLKALFLPFGFHPRVIITHVFYKYIFKLFWPWLLLWLVGVIVFLKQKNKTKEQKLYFYYLLPITYYLLLYYGSWFFQDALDPNLVSIGSSYVRYFLPMFVFSMPLIAFLLVKTWGYRKILLRFFLIFVSCFLFLVSCRQALFNRPESLVSIKEQLIQYQLQAAGLLKYIQKDDIILMDTGTDKILFPERKHLIVPQAGVEWPEIHKILPYKNVFYFHHTAEVGQDYLNQVKFEPNGLELDNEVLIEGGGVVYKIRFSTPL